MQYPFISILPLIAEVQSDLKRIVKTSSFTEEDCYIWAVDCIRQIGGNNYDESVTKLKIVKNCAKLPDNFYIVNEIGLCVGDCANCLHKDELTMCPIASGRVLVPGDTATLMHCNRKYTPNLVDFAGKYTIKMPPGIIRFPVSSGYAMLTYEGLRKDTDNTIMIQDEINGILATKNYIKVMLLQEKWILKEINSDVYDHFTQAYEDHLAKAQSKMKFVDHSTTKLRARMQHSRYSKLSYKHQ